MCGIIGILNKENSDDLTKQGLKIINNRGLDNTNTYSWENNTFGHVLHAIVDIVTEPITKKGTIIANCEIYNWKELKKKYKLDSKNDAEVILDLIDIRGTDNIKEILNEFDGVYAFAYLNQDKSTITIARDIIGVKPLFYDEKNFAFASEKKVLTHLGFTDIKELIPREILTYDIQKNIISKNMRDFFKIIPEHTDDFTTIKNNTKELLIKSITKRLPDKKVPIGILMSGGIDSTFIAKIIKEHRNDVICYTAGYWQDGTKEPDDIVFAKRVCKELDIKLKVKRINLKEVEEYLKTLVPLIEDSNVVKVGVALPFFISCKMAKEDGIRVIYSGLGSEEIFAGYQRHKTALNINKECLFGLHKMYERDMYRDDVVTMNNNMELRLPFLDKDLITYTLKIPSEYKIKNEVEKWILRQIAHDIKVPAYVANRKKKAAQYGSRFDKAIKRLTKKAGLQFKSEYLKQFYSIPNQKLGVLFSSGKDSCYALYTMQKQNYDISCLITIRSKNKDSYMFHTPNINIADMQAKAANLPILIWETKGEKETELNDLKDAIIAAKKQYNITGIVTGALYSTYQRDRIEKICDELGLKSFSPLWHIEQEMEMRDLISKGFKFVFSSVAGEGFDKSWVGKEITKNDIDKLANLNKKYGINIAGEGGEFESLVIDAPFFKKYLNITADHILTDGEHIAKYIVDEVELINKD